MVVCFVEADPSASKPARQAIRSWFDFGLGTGKGTEGLGTGLETGKPSASVSAHDNNTVTNNSTAGVGMTVSALYAAAPGGNKYGTPLRAKSNTAVGDKQRDGTPISAPSGRTVINTTPGRTVMNTKNGPTTNNHQEVVSPDYHRDEMKDEAMHHSLTEGGVINENRADDDESMGSHTDDHSFVSALEGGDLLGLGSSSLDDASLSSGGSWDTEDSRSPSRSQDQHRSTRNGTDQKRRKKRGKRMVIMERGGSVLLPDCSPYFETGKG